MMIRLRQKSFETLVSYCSKNKGRVQRRFITSSRSFQRSRSTTAAASEEAHHHDQRNSSSTNNNSTLRPGEVEKFEKLSGTWWNASGPMQELRSMNVLRVPLIRDGLLKSQQQVQDEDMTETPTPLEKFSLIDVGCGGGILTEPLARLGASVLGLDPGQDNISIAKSHLPNSLKSKVTYECTTLEEFAARNQGGKKFDGIIMSEVIEHLDNPSVVIAAASSLIKDGGSIFTTTQNRTLESWAGVILAWEYILRRLPVGTHDWNKFLTPAELQSVLSQHGFRTKLVHGMKYNPVTNKWSWTSSTAIGYCIHAIKDIR